MNKEESIIERDYQLDGRLARFGMIEIHPNPRNRKLTRRLFHKYAIPRAPHITLASRLTHPPALLTIQQSTQAPMQV